MALLEILYEAYSSSNHIPPLPNHCSLPRRLFRSARHCTVPHCPAPYHTTFIHASEGKAGERGSRSRPPPPSRRRRRRRCRFHHRRHCQTPLPQTPTLPLFCYPFVSFHPCHRSPRSFSRVIMPSAHSQPKCHGCNGGYVLRRVLIVLTL